MNDIDSRWAVNRLIGRWKEERKLERKVAKGQRSRECADAVLLAEVDAAHEDSSVPQCDICWRGRGDQGDQRYARLAKISVSHLYNLRSATYRRQR